MFLEDLPMLRAQYLLSKLTSVWIVYPSRIIPTHLFYLSVRQEGLFSPPPRSTTLLDHGQLFIRKFRNFWLAVHLALNVQLYFSWVCRYRSFVFHCWTNLWGAQYVIKMLACWPRNQQRQTPHGVHPKTVNSTATLAVKLHIFFDMTNQKNANCGIKRPW